MHKDTHYTSDSVTKCSSIKQNRHFDGSSVEQLLFTKISETNISRNLNRNGENQLRSKYTCSLTPRGEHNI